MLFGFIFLDDGVIKVVVKILKFGVDCYDYKDLMVELLIMI